MLAYYKRYKDKRWRYKEECNGRKRTAKRKAFRSGAFRFDLSNYMNSCGVAGSNDLTLVDDVSGEEAEYGG